MDQRRVIIHSFLFSFFMVGVKSSGKMTILLLNYKNPEHEVFNGDCCDNLNFCSWNECDNLFKFCATAQGSTESCSLSGGQLTTGILGDDDFSFPGQGGHLGGGLNNPVTFSFQEWKGVSVVVEVWDDDGGFIVGKLADFVDKYTLIETTAPDSNKSSSTPRDKKLCGKRSCTNVKVRVYCDDTYLIPECTEYCVTSDSDEEGHYWCDYGLGRKVCHEGWYDALTNCTKKKKECTPRNDTIGGHYDCDPESGDKICLSGWMGKNCTQVYVSNSVIPSASSKELTKEIKSTSLHQSTIQGLSSTAATNTKIQPTPSLRSHPTSSEDLKTSRISADFPAGYSSSQTRLTTTQIVEYKSTASATTISPSTVQYSMTSKIQYASVAVTMEKSKEMSDYTIQGSASSFVKESSSFRVRASSLYSTLAEVATVSEVGSSYKTPSSTRLQYTTRELSIDISTIAFRSSVAVSSTLGATPIVPTTEWNYELVLNVIPGKNWTEEKEDKLKSAITEQANKYCKLHPTSCKIDPDVSINRTEFFNSSDVIIFVKNGSNDVVYVSIQVKLPSNIPGISMGGTLPSVVLKKVITANKNTIEKQIGLKVSLKSLSSSTVTKPTIQPTTDAVVVIVSTPLSSFIPWNLWIYIVGACVACLLLLGATLGFKYKMNRQNKIHAFDDSPERKETMTRQEEEEMVCLSNTPPLISNKNTLKVKFQDTILRARTSSVNSDKSVLYSPFTPDYSGS